MAQAGPLTYAPSKQPPPSIQSEFRGAWVATVGNIDWPSKPGLPVQQQRAELLAILDRATELRLNAVILQVRPACDALYASSFEPWSEYLTGRMGQPPHPFYDPLAFAVDECHKRGLELHAWFNPFRARHLKALSPVSATHISKTRPHWVRRYGKLLWLDPGEPAAQDHTIKVILDVLRRYDVDGIHLDDYFYPYRIRDGNGRTVGFDDTATWKGNSAGRLNHDDWRRQNIDRFVERLYIAVKAEKPFVKFGISPPGIWRPRHPPQIQGHDAYTEIYADSRKWLQQGWVDYLAPQLYWDIASPAQSYPVLLKWWTEQNPKKRHLWPGNDVSRIGPDDRSVNEILNQLTLTRQTPGASGNIFWNFKPLLQNRQGLSDTLKHRHFTGPALPPALIWCDPLPPKTPLLQVASSGGALHAIWVPTTNEVVRWWVLGIKTNGGSWNVQIVDGRQSSMRLQGNPHAVALAAVDRAGNMSPYAVLEKAAAPVMSKAERNLKPAKVRQVYLPPKLRS